MEQNEQRIDPKQIAAVIEKRLVRAPQALKNKFPAVLKQERVSWATISEPEYLMVVFLTLEEEQRVNDFISKQLNPFPGLITTGNEGAAFRIDKSRNMNMRSCKVLNSFALSLGPDSTILLEDHSQTITTQGRGPISYGISLAYIVSYGDEINNATLFDYFEGLIVYSTNMWREADV